MGIDEEDFAGSIPVYTRAEGVYTRIDARSVYIYIEYIWP